jgi:hypothetical protein
LCLGHWSVLDLVKDGSIRASLMVDEVGEDADELAEDWDTI